MTLTIICAGVPRVDKPSECVLGALTAKNVCGQYEPELGHAMSSIEIHQSVRLKQCKDEFHISRLSASLASAPSTCQSPSIIKQSQASTARRRGTASASMRPLVY